MLHGFSPAAAPAEAPITAKTASPSASTRRNARSSSSHLRPFAATCHPQASRQPSKANRVYRFVVNATGVRWRRASRMTPPPMAVAKPRTRIPSRSRFFRIALNAPDIAKAQVPTRSKSRKTESWVTGQGGRLRGSLPDHDLDDPPLHSPQHVEARDVPGRHFRQEAVEIVDAFHRLRVHPHHDVPRQHPGFTGRAARIEGHHLHPGFPGQFEVPRR